MSQLFVRAARPEDLDLLVSWALAMAWETEEKRLEPEVLRRGVATALGDPSLGRYFVCEKDGAPAGTLMLTTEWSDWRCGHWWWIQSVYVAPEHRRAGVYRALHAHVLALAQSRGDVYGLRLYVEKENAAAQRTYRAQGMDDAGYLLFEQPARPGSEQ
jgi:GNAT superfamily N-acetyltransferase